MYGALYGQHPMIQGIALLQDLKLGQYVKLAPRVTFLMQIIGTSRALQVHHSSAYCLSQVPWSVLF